MKDSFSSYHPLVNFLFFAEVLGFSMFLLHPLCLGISLVCAVGYDIYLNGRKAVGFCLKGYRKLHSRHPAVTRATARRENPGS